MLVMLIDSATMLQVETSSGIELFFVLFFILNRGHINSALLLLVKYKPILNNSLYYKYSY